MVELSLSFIKYHVVKTWGVKIQLRTFLTSALDGGEWSVLRPGRVTAWKEPLIPVWLEAGWAPEPVWTRRPKRNPFFAPTGNRTPVVQPVV
jgi:hypothetical protein